MVIRNNMKIIVTLIITKIFLKIFNIDKIIDNVYIDLIMLILYC